MKRNFDLLRDIMIDLEEWKEDAPLQTAFLKYEGITPLEIDYHAKLLIESGYIEGAQMPSRMGKPTGAVLLSLTMSGHDFLDVARNKVVWDKAKAHIDATVTSASLDVFQDVLRAESRTQLGL